MQMFYKFNLNETKCDYDGVDGDDDNKKITREKKKQMKNVSIE